jgi:hypothetical protein
MPSIDDLAAVRRLLDVPGPRDDVTAAGRARLDELARCEADWPRARQPHRALALNHRRRTGVRAAVACGLATAAAATAVVVARPGTAAHPAGSPASTSPKGDQSARAGSVQQAILTAVGSVSDDILYIRVTSSGTPAGMAPPLSQYWLWPAKAAPGQQASLLISGDGAQSRMTFTQVTGNANGNPQPVTGTAWTFDPTTRTWTPSPGRPVPAIPERASLYLLDKNFMLKNFVHDSEIVKSRTTVDGVAAIELSYPGANGTLHLLLWVNAQTYLPLRMEKLHWLNDYPDSKQQYDYQFLSPTPANLAKLKLTGPPGDQRSSSPAANREAGSRT